MIAIARPGYPGRGQLDLGRHPGACLSNFIETERSYIKIAGAVVLCNPTALIQRQSLGMTGLVNCAFNTPEILSNNQKPQ